MFQLLGKQALLSDLPGKKKPQSEPPERGKGAGKDWRRNAVTLESAVSRILSPVVDIATEERVSQSGTH